MILELATVVALANQCAPSVAPETLVSVVHAESHFDPFAIGVNARGVTAPEPHSKDTAIAAARLLIGRGHNIDLGLGQINSSNLKWLGLSIEDAFDPCRNLAAAARVLSGNYLSVVRSSPSAEAAIATAMSMYNTGSRTRGFGNGYVGRVYASSGIVIPAMTGSTVRPGSPAVIPIPAVEAPAERPQAAVASPARWETSAGLQGASLMVFGGASNTSAKGQPE